MVLATDLRTLNIAACASKEDEEKGVSTSVKILLKLLSKLVKVFRSSCFCLGAKKVKHMDVNVKKQEKD